MFDPYVFEEKLSIEEYKRYSRHLVLEEIGAVGQSRLKLSKVLIIGVGGLGSLASMYLVSAGIGQVGIVDYDIVSLSNLQRQVLYKTESVDRKKVLEGKGRLQQINPYCKIVVFDTKLTTYNVTQIVSDYDIILDASDNFFTRYLLSDISILHSVPIVYGAILGQQGQLSVFNYRGGPTYRDLFYEKPQDNIAISCSEGGVFGGLAAVISSLQVNEVMKIILGLRNVISGQLLIYDFSTAVFRKVLLRKRLVYSRNKALICLRKLRLEEKIVSKIENYTSVRDVFASEFRSLIKADNCLLIDVRSCVEYQSMHIAHAQSIPLEELREKSILDFLSIKIAEGYSLLVYCSFNSRSITAVNILSEFGIKSLRLQDGLKALGF